MNTYIFIPPVRKPTGGITVLCQIASILQRNAQPVSLVMRDSGGWMPQISDGYPEPVHWDRMKLTNEDLWLVPEGWVNSLAPGLNAGARCVVYCQNWAYLFSSLPEGVSWTDLPVSFLAVSHPVEWFMQQTVGQVSPILRPGIDVELFHAPEKKPAGKIRVAYMPRKNKALVSRIRSIFEARNQAADVRWTEIAGMDAQGVAETLRSCHIFLASGFPEGCPLPRWRHWLQAVSRWVFPGSAAGTTCASLKVRISDRGGRCGKSRGPATDSGPPMPTCWTRHSILRKRYSFGVRKVRVLTEHLKPGNKPSGRIPRKYRKKLFWISGKDFDSRLTVIRLS